MVYRTLLSISSVIIMVSTVGASSGGGSDSGDGAPPKSILKKGDVPQKALRVRIAEGEPDVRETLEKGDESRKKYEGTAESRDLEGSLDTPSPVASPVARNTELNKTTLGERAEGAPAPLTSAERTRIKEAKADERRRQTALAEEKARAARAEMDKELDQRPDEEWE